MDTLNAALQPFWDLINIFQAVFMLGLVGFGVASAFFLEDLIKSLMLAGIISVIATSLSSFLPGLAPQVIPYFWALGIGFAIGGIAKWVIRKSQ